MFFLQKFEKYLSNQVEVFAYCLMPNHFHFLIRVKAGATRQTTKVSKTFVVSKSPLTPLEKAFRDFFISYAKAVNKRYNRTGGLFQYKFKRKEVNQEKYFIDLVNYIHLNPIKAGLCGSYEEWKFSSYNSIISSQPSHVKRDEVLEYFGGKDNFLFIHQQMKDDFSALSEVLFD